MKLYLNNSSLIFGTTPQDVVITDITTETDILKKLQYAWAYTGVYTENGKQCYIKVSEGDQIVLDNTDYNTYQYYMLAKSNPSTWPTESLTDATYVVKNGNYYANWCEGNQVKTITIPSGVEYLMVNYANSGPAGWTPLKSVTIKA